MVQWESWNWKTWHWRKHVSIIINAHCHVLREGDIITLHVLSTVSLYENSSSIKVLYQPHPDFKQRKNTATLEVINKNYTQDNASKPISQVWNIVWPQKWFVFFLFLVWASMCAKVTRWIIKLDQNKFWT